MGEQLLITYTDLVHDTDEDIKEVVHYLPDHVRRLVHHKDRLGLGSAERDDLPYPDRDGRGNIKGVYRVKLKDNTMIAIDLAGAQYSVLHTTIMPWLAYCNKWVSTIKFQIPFRSHYEKHMESMSNYRCITHLTIIMEQMIYLHVFITFAERELGFHLKDLSSMCYDDFKDARAQVLQQAIHYLRRRSQELDSDRSAMSMLKTFDLRHPAVAKAVKAKSMLFDFGDMKNIDWDMLRELIRMPNSVVKYKEKVKLRTLLTHRACTRCLEIGDWSFSRIRCRAGRSRMRALAKIRTGCADEMDNYVDVSTVVTKVLVLALHGS